MGISYFITIRLKKHRWFVLQEQIRLSNIDHFKLVSNFSRISTEHNGSYSYVRKYLQTKKVNNFQAISKVNDLQMTTVELLDYKFILVCMYIYRSPDGDFHTFLNNSETAIWQVQSKKEKKI